MFKVNESCPHCGLRIEKGDGAFLGPFVINYTVTAFGFIIPVILLYATGRIGPTSTLAPASCRPGAMSTSASPPAAPAAPAPRRSTPKAS